MKRVKEKLTENEKTKRESGQEAEELDEKEIKESEKEVEEGKIEQKKDIKKIKDGWKPKTKLGKKVNRGEIKDIDEILDKGKRILEPEIVDILLPNLETDLLLIGQAKGKFGGGQRRVFKQVQKKTSEGNKPHFATLAVVGNKDGYVGIGYGKSKETVPARDKALRNAKLNLIKINRGCGSWECSCGGTHTIPFKVQGKCGSVKVELMPAPKGKGLIIEEECAKVLNLAGIDDIWSRSFGKTKFNLINACVDALKKLNQVKTR